MDCWRLPPDAILSAFFASLRIHHNLRLLIQLSFTYCLSCPIRCYGNRRRTSAAASRPHQVSTSSRIATLVTHRRSMAERGGCFQRRLFVYLFVYQHDNCRSITRKMMKLGGCMHCTKNLTRVRIWGSDSWVPTSRKCGGLQSHYAKDQQTDVGVAGVAVGHATTSTSK